jgi:hypothetical protein
MRDRLIEILKKSGASFENALPEEIADHLLAEGVIVPPCKVGQTVYVVNDLTHGIAEGFVSKLEYNRYTTPQEWITVNANDSMFGWYEKKHRIDRVFGKTVFLTREEAEKALERSKE